MCRGWLSALALAWLLSACGGEDFVVGDSPRDGGRGGESEQVEFCPDSSHPRVHYRERDPALCDDVTLDCTEEQNGFQNSCGCGCIDKAGDALCPIEDDSSITWLSRDPAECPEVPPACPLGQIGFTNSCGCGCIER